MSITPAFRDGLRRVLSSPTLMFLLAVVSFMAGTAVVARFSYKPYSSWSEILVVYSIIRAWWTGGILHRYAQNRPMRAGAFQRACGTFFFRLLRLHLLSALILGGSLYVAELMMFNQINLGVMLGFGSLFGLGYIFCDVVLDYAKIRTVVEDRRSMVFAITAGFRFVVRRPGAVVRLYLLDATIGFIGFGSFVLVNYSLVPVGLHWLLVLLIVALGMVVVAGWVPLLFLSTQTAFFQDELAYPGYTVGSGVSPPDLPVTEVVAGPPTNGV
jgi:hypothetical protein